MEDPLDRHSGNADQTPGADEDSPEGEIVSRLRRLREEWGRKERRKVTIAEAAGRLGFSRNRLTQLELGQNDEVKNEELARLCNRYTNILGRVIQPGDILGFEPPKTEPASTWAIAGMMA